MTQPGDEYSGLVLAGGQSRRMSQDKALLPFRGTTLLEHAVQQLRACCSEVAIASSQTQHQLANATLLKDQTPDQGPLSGLISGLEHSQAPQLLVLPCDTPLVPLSALHSLMEIDTEVPSAIVFRETRQIHPLIGSYPKTLLPTLRQAFREGERSIIRLLSKIPVVFIEANANLSWYRPGVFQNINTPEDYQTLLES